MEHYQQFNAFHICHICIHKMFVHIISTKKTLQWTTVVNGSLMLALLIMWFLFLLVIRIVSFNLKNTFIILYCRVFTCMHTMPNVFMNSLSLSLSQTHARTHAPTPAHTRSHTYMQNIYLQNRKLTHWCCINSAMFSVSTIFLFLISTRVIVYTQTRHVGVNLV